MRDSRSLRILTMVLVATWWPGHWSCCRLHASTHGTLEIGDDARMVEGSGASMACCAEGPEMPGAMACDSTPRSPAGSGCGVSCSPGTTDKTRPCRCVVATTDAPLPLATTSLSLDKHGRIGVDFLTELSPAVAVIVTADQPPRTRACRGSPRHPAASSLLALHCQLTT